MKSEVEERESRLLEQQQKMRDRMAAIEQEAIEKQSAAEEAKKAYVPPKQVSEQLRSASFCCTLRACSACDRGWQVREGPPINSTVSVYWAGDGKWEQGVVEERVGTDDAPKFKAPVH